MAEGRQRASWRQTAEICCTIANSQRDAKAQPQAFEWQQFFPYDDDNETPADERSTPEEWRRAFLGW